MVSTIHAATPWIPLVNGPGRTFFTLDYSGLLWITADYCGSTGKNLEAATHAPPNPVGLLRKNGYQVKVIFSNGFCCWCPSRKTFELFETGLDEFSKACSGSEIKVSWFGFGEALASPKMETFLFRRLSIQLSLGGSPSCSAPLCLTGRWEFNRFIG